MYMGVFVHSVLAGVVVVFSASLWSKASKISCFALAKCVPCSSLGVPGVSLSKSFSKSADGDTAFGAGADVCACEVGCCTLLGIGAKKSLSKSCVLSADADADMMLVMMQ